MTQNGEASSLKSITERNVGTVSKDIIKVNHSKYYVRSSNGQCVSANQSKDVFGSSNGKYNDKHTMAKKSNDVARSSSCKYRRFRADHPKDVVESSDCVKLENMPQYIQAKILSYLEPNELISRIVHNRPAFDALAKDAMKLALHRVRESPDFIGIFLHWDPYTFEMILNCLDGNVKKLLIVGDADSELEDIGIELANKILRKCPSIHSLRFRNCLTKSFDTSQFFEIEGLTLIDLYTARIPLKTTRPWTNLTEFHGSITPGWLPCVQCDKWSVIPQKLFLAFYNLNTQLVTVGLHILRAYCACDLETSKLLSRIRSWPLNERAIREFYITNERPSPNIVSCIIKSPR